VESEKKISKDHQRPSKKRKSMNQQEISRNDDNNLKNFKNVRLAAKKPNFEYFYRIFKFYKENGTLNRFSHIDGKPLNLYKLNKTIQLRGRHRVISKLRKWNEIIQDLEYDSQYKFALRESYKRWLSGYEKHIRRSSNGEFH
jgi:hypothetical protein